MNKSIKFVPAQISKRLIAMTLDILCVVLTTVALFFIGLFAFVNTLTPYKDNEKFIHEKQVEVGLTLDSGLSYEEYENFIKGFYLRYEDEIVNLYSIRYEKTMTIQHIYNVNVLELPIEPSLDNMNTDYFTYIQDSVTGQIDVNTFGIIIPGEHGHKFYEDAGIILEMAYNHIDNLLVSIDTPYHDAVMENLRIESYTRLVSFSLAIIIFYLIIPLTNKNRCTIFENQYGFAHINNRNGYRVSLFKVILRPVVFWGISLLIITLSINLKMIVMAILPIFISYLLLIFTKTNRTIDQFILSSNVVSGDESLVFNDKDEESEYEASDEYRHVEDEDYLERLSSVSAFNISESRSDELNKDKPKNIEPDNK